VAKARIDARLTRLQAGLLGNCKAVGAGVFELKDDFGPGYRIYFAEDNQDLVLLLCGGDKSTQRTDIQIAKAYWADYQEKKQEQVNQHEKKRKSSVP
jgi:putative addiction module killer protein